MPVSQTMTFTATPPTTGETPTTFNYNAIACWNELKTNVVPDLNTAFGEMNTLETNVNAKEVSANYSADIATAAANFQGEWTSKGYTLGQSVSSGGTTYMCKLTHVTGFAVTDTTYWQPTGLSGIINGATEKTTPIDADIIGIGDSVASFSLKKLTWANIKATMKTYTDTLYVALTGAQTVAGVKTFSSNPLSSAAQDTAISALTRKDYVDTKAPLASPALTGSPTAPTQSSADDSTKIATTAWARIGLSGSLVQNGFISFPTWLGGLKIQWVVIPSCISGNQNITFPIANIVNVFGIFGTIEDAVLSAAERNFRYTNITLSSATVNFGNGATVTNARVFIIGN